MKGSFDVEVITQHRDDRLHETAGKVSGHGLLREDPLPPSMTIEINFDPRTNMYPAVMGICEALRDLGLTGP